MLTDIEIAQQCRMRPITEIAATAGIDEEYLEQYGRYKAKIDHRLLMDRADRPDGKLILVTAINPTPAGEGKTTTSVGLADGLRKLGKNAVAALREPSLGPVFGVKGGAAGGGYAQVVPMEDINLHFTGDFHAIGAANNLLAAMLDNHIQQGNALGIDVKQITWKRCVDMNDRQLRHIIDGIGGKMQGVPREDGFDITVASEVMAVLCLSSGITDLKERLGRMIVAYTYDGKPVTAHDLKAEGAMTALLKDALKPNLVQTLEGTPTLIHGGPFANIAHGCNSVTATRMALKLGDYAVTEAGFGADLGAEKFLDIKCRLAGLRPSAVVVVATVRALKSHGGVPKAELGKENLAALEKAANGEIVALPGWTEEQPFVARLKRASLTGMIRAGKIPNPLIAAAQKLYEGLNKSRANATFEETAKVIRLVVEEALAEPTMEQLKAAGLDLTEEQADQIYLYAIKGAKVLEAFRSQPANRQPDPSGDDVQAAPQQPDGD